MSDGIPELDLADIEAQLQDIEDDEGMEEDDGEEAQVEQHDAQARMPKHTGEEEGEECEEEAWQEEDVAAEKDHNAPAEAVAQVQVAAAEEPSADDAHKQHPEAAQQSIKAPDEPSPAHSKPHSSSTDGAASGIDPDLVKAIVESSEPPPPAKKAPKQRGGLRKARTGNAGEKNAAPVAAKSGKKPRQKSAFQKFAAEQRPLLKNADPELSMTDVTKQLAEQWRAMNAADKKPYEDQAAAENTHLAATAARAKASPRAKSAYQLFCNARRGSVKQANPEASFGAIAKLLAKAWKEASAAEKKGLEEQAKQSTAAGVPKAKGGGPEQSAAKASPKGASGQDIQQAVVEQSGKAGAADTEEEPSDRENCDWEEHPAEAVLGVTLNKKLIVKRKGLDLTEFGLVDAQAVKRQRLDKGSKQPVSLDMLEEYEEWESRFKKAVVDNTRRGALEMDDLEQGSLLETCYFLGKLREKEYPLSKVEKGREIGAKFPVIGLSMASQRFLDLEKGRRVAAETEVASLRKQLGEALYSRAAAMQAEV